MSQVKVDDKDPQLRPPTIVISMQLGNKKDKQEKKEEEKDTKTIKHTTPQPRITLNRNHSIPLSRSSASLRTMATTRSPSNKRTERFFYRSIKVLGKGAFGVVYCSKGRNGELVAVKKVQLNPHFKNRELDILRKLDHPNCIRLLDEFTTNDSYMTSSISAISRQTNKSGDSHSSSKKNELSIVMDYLPLTLHQFSVKYHKSQKQTPLIYTKLFAYQLFTGLFYLHDKLKITHRDIKPENILVDTETGLLRICDFGSAKELVPNEKSVSYIASRYYRAPELIMGCEFYTTAIDIWAAGCVIAEILTCGIPLFAAHESSKQLEEIAAIIGPPKNKDLQSFQHPPVNFKIETSQGIKSPQSLKAKQGKSSASLTANINLKTVPTSNSTTISSKGAPKNSKPKLTLNYSEPTKTKNKVDEISHASSMSSTNSPHMMRKKVEQILTQRTTLERSLPSNTPPELLELLKSIFVYNPSKRPSADQCMSHIFFADLFTGKLHLPSGFKLPHLEKPPTAPSPLVPQS